MHGTAPITRRRVVFAFAALTSALVSACGPTTPLDATLPPTQTRVPSPIPGETRAANAGTPALPMPPTALPTPVPTLPPPSNAEIATGTALAGTSVVFSQTATAVAPPANGLSAIATGGPVIVVATEPATATPVPTLPLTPTPVPPTVAPATQAAVNRARMRFDRITALHFALGIEGLVYLDTARTERLLSADGDLLRPDRVAATGRVALGGITAQLKFIQIADSAFLTNPITGRWGNAPAGFSYDPRVVFDPENGVTAILGRVNTWTLIDMPKIAGVDTQHLRGTVPTTVVNALVTNSMRGETVDVDVYIEGKNNDIVRFVIAEQAAAITDGSPPARWTLDLSKQNEAVKIDAPTVGAQAPR